MNLRDYQMRLFLAITTLLLSFALISCNDDKIDNLSVGACTIEGKGLDEKGNPTKKDITVSCTENVTKDECSILETGVKLQYKPAIRQLLQTKKNNREINKILNNLPKDALPEGKFRANAKCPEPKRLASCKIGNVVTYAYDSGIPSLNTQLKNGLKVSCTAPNVYTDLSESSEN